MAGPRTTSRFSSSSSRVRPCQSGCSWVWLKWPGTTRAPEADLAVVGDGGVPGDEPEEVALAGSVGAEDGDALAVPELGVERVGEAMERQPLDHQRLAAGAASAQADVDHLVLDQLRWLGALVEVAQPGLGRLEPAGEGVGDLGPLPHHLHQLHQPGPLVLPQRGVAGQALVPSRPGLVVAGEPAAVGPRALGLDGDDLGRGAGQQLAVVADEQDGLGAAAQLVLEPPLAGDVEEVVRLVEEQDGGIAPQQRLEREALLLAAGAGGDPAVADLVEGEPQDLGGDGVPEDLDLVPADLGPVADRLGVGDGRRRVVRAGLVQRLGPGEPLAGGRARWPERRRAAAGPPWCRPESSRRAGA